MTLVLYKVIAVRSDQVQELHGDEAEANNLFDFFMEHKGEQAYDYIVMVQLGASVPVVVRQCVRYTPNVSVMVPRTREG